MKNGIIFHRGMEIKVKGVELGMVTRFIYLETVISDDASKF